LEPVAAYLLVRGDGKTRSAAEESAPAYYDSTPVGTDANELLDPRAIRDWAQGARREEVIGRPSVDFQQSVRLTHDAVSYQNSAMYVTPIEIRRLDLDRQSRISGC
jgi:hypothetical protein